MSLFIEKTDKTTDAGRPIWRLTADFHWSPLQIGFNLKVPAGFETDLVALPNFIRPKDSDVYRQAAVVHDYLVHTGVNHLLVDVLFLTQLAELNVSTLRFWVVRGYLFLKRLFSKWF